MIAKQTPLDPSIYDFASLQWLEGVRQDNFSDPQVGLLPLDMLVRLIVERIGMHFVTVHLDPHFTGNRLRPGALRCVSLAELPSGVAVGSRCPLRRSAG